MLVRACIVVQSSILERRNDVTNVFGLYRRRGRLRAAMLYWMNVQVS